MTDADIYFALALIAAYVAVQGALAVAIMRARRRAGLSRLWGIAALLPAALPLAMAGVYQGVLTSDEMVAALVVFAAVAPALLWAAGGRPGEDAAKDAAQDPAKDAAQDPGDDDANDDTPPGPRAG